MLLTPVLMIFTDFLSAVVTSEIAQIRSLYGGLNVFLQGCLGTLVIDALAYGRNEHGF